MGEFVKLRLALPSMREQERVAESVLALAKRTDAERRMLYKLRLTKTALM